MMNPQYMPPMPPAYPTTPPMQYMPPQQIQQPPVMQQQVPPVPVPPPAIDQVAENKPIVPPAKEEKPAPQVKQETKPQEEKPVENLPPVEDTKSKSTTAVDPAVQPLSQALETITFESGKKPSQEEQSVAIQTIAQYAKTAQAANEMVKMDPNSPEAKEAKKKTDTLIKPMLIDEKMFKGLANISVSDTSKLSEAEKQKADENKIISMWTLAMLQRLFKDEMNEELKKENIPPMSVNEVPGVSQIVVNVKSDPNPDVREAGIVALMEVADSDNPRDAETMKMILQTAIDQDNAKNVKNTAKNALKNFKK